MMGFTITNIQLLLFIAALTAIITNKFRVPYSVGLVLVGEVLSLWPYFDSITMTKDLIYKVLLPPLIFEAGLFLPRKELLRNFSIIFTMATVGVLLSALVITFCVVHFLHWPLISAALFAVLISATDPVAVIAIFKQSGADARLKLLMEAEALLNDGTAAVLFATIVGFWQTGTMSASSVSLNFVLLIAGSLVCGAAIAGASLFFINKTDDNLVKITFTTVIAYGSFLLAEYFHLSGILSTLTAGLLVGHKATATKLYDASQIAVQSFWEYLAFVSNSFIFLLIGLQEMRKPLIYNMHPLVLVFILVLIGRAVAIYPIAWTFSKSRLAVKLREQHVLVWGGLRGALALALSLGLPENFPYRAQIQVTTFLVVAFSIILQGITIKPFLYWLNLIPKQKH